MSKAITPTTKNQKEQFQADLEAARSALLAAEAELAAEQAAVNAFRMQCHLKLGDLIEEVLALRTKRETLLTRLQLLRQAQDFGIPYDEDDPFWQGEADESEPFVVDEEELILPELVTPAQDKAAAKRLYRELARRFHPDLAATNVERAYMTAMMAAVNVAYEKENFGALRDLAGELDPEATAELAQIDNRELRRLREQILKCQRRRRKVQNQFQALKQDNVAKLWRKAKELEENGRNWWDVVKRDLQRVAAKTQAEVERLQEQLAQLDPEFA